MLLVEELNTSPHIHGSKVPENSRTDHNFRLIRGPAHFRFPPPVGLHPPPIAFPVPSECLATPIGECDNARFLNWVAPFMN